MHDRFVDDAWSKRSKNEPNGLLEAFNAYHPNIKFSVDENSDHFLDTAFEYAANKFSSRKAWKTAHTLVVTNTNQVET